VRLFWGHCGRRGLRASKGRRSNEGGQDSVEQIRRREVSRALKRINLSPEEEEAIERLSRSLVDKLLFGPSSSVMARAEAEISFGDDEACVKREFDVENNRVSNNPT
jgi:glutamyl-tRNA reductase